MDEVINAKGVLAQAKLAYKGYELRALPAPVKGYSPLTPRKGS